jgi:hypothetical protein
MARKGQNRSLPVPSGTDVCLAEGRQSSTGAVAATRDQRFWKVLSSGAALHWDSQYLTTFPSVTSHITGSKYFLPQGPSPPENEVVGFLGSFWKMMFGP